MLITIVVTSAVIFALVRADVIHVKPQTEEVSLLDMEFLPYAAENILVIKEFQFCADVDKNFNCVSPKKLFKRGEEVHFRFVVESSTSSGEIKLSENYQFKNANRVILGVEDKTNFQFNLQSNKDKDNVKFKDYFVAGYDLQPGEYILDLVMENPLLGKKATLSKKVRIE